MLVAVNIVAARYTDGAARSDGGAPLHAVARHPQTLAHIDEPITLRFYYSAKLGQAIPAYGVYAQRVRELLDQYVAEAHGKLRLEVYQPQPFSDVEDRAVAFGLQGVPAETRRASRSISALPGPTRPTTSRSVAFFAPERERFLEYDLTRLVHLLAYRSAPSLG